MISSLLVFLILGIITYLYFTISINALILKFDTNKIIEKPLALIFSLALAPFITSLLLHYLLFFFPYQNAILYVLAVISVFTFLLMISKDFIKTALKYVLSKFKFTKKNTTGELLLIDNKYVKIYQKGWIILFPNLVLVLLILVACFFWFKQILFTPITGHDMLEYAIQGKHFAREKLIAYGPNRYHVENDFFYVGLHGFSFPLIGTWEYLFSEIFGVYKNDYLMKSISGYYSFLIFAIIYVFIKKYNIFIALAAILLLFLNYGVSITLFSYHIDSYRIFMILAAFAGLALAIKFPSNITLFIFGVNTAAQAYIHSLGVFIALFFCFAFLIYFPGTNVQKVKKCFLLLIIILLFGGMHYILDIFWGTGWIFQEIKYY